MDQQIIISSTSGNSCTVCMPDALPEYHRRLLDECEMLRDHLERVVKENESLHKVVDKS